MVTIHLLTKHPVTLKIAILFRCISLSSTYPGQSVGRLVGRLLTLTEIFTVSASLDMSASVDHKASYVFQKLSAFRFPDNDERTDNKNPL